MRSSVAFVFLVLVLVLAGGCGRFPEVERADALFEDGSIDVPDGWQFVSRDEADKMVFYAYATGAQPPSVDDLVLSARFVSEDLPQGLIEAYRGRGYDLIGGWTSGECGVDLRMVNRPELIYDLDDETLAAANRGDEILVEVVASCNSGS